MIEVGSGLSRAAHRQELTGDRRMRNSTRTWVVSLLAVAAVGWNLGCEKHAAPPPPSPTVAASRDMPIVGGEKAVELRRKQSGDGSVAEFLSVTLLPGRGMNVFEITAYLPGRGEIPLLASPSLQDAAATLNGGPDDFNGNKSFSMGGALLFPFANRILGKLSVDKQTGEHEVTARWHGRSVDLPANWHGKRPGAPLQAMHGEMLASKADNVQVQPGPDGAVATALYHLNTPGAWFSTNDVTVTVTLTRDTVTLDLTAANTGQREEPVGVGWHPYFQLPSGIRANARLHVPAKMRTEVNNYDDVFPTGKLLSVTGTDYDFNSVEGAPLPDKLVDDSFVRLTRNSQGYAVSEIRDLGTNYGMRITAMTPLVRAIQAYSPTDKSFIALEPQFNYADPFGREWHGMDTGMVTVQPGKSVTWKTQLQLFQPANDFVGQGPRPVQKTK